MKNVIITFAMILLSLSVSCSPDFKTVTSLKGRTYVNEQTQDKIEFTGDDTVVFTWSNYPGDLGSYQRNQPYAFHYEIHDNRELHVWGPALSQSPGFPYRIMELSPSKDTIFADQNWKFERKP